MSLKQQDDKQLIRNVLKKSCNDSTTELYERYSKIYFNLVNKAIKQTPSLESYNVVNDVYSVLFQAAKSYEPSRKTKFSSWFHTVSRFYLKNYFRTLKPLICAENEQLDFLLEEYATQNNDDTIDYVFSILNEIPDKRIKDIFYYRFYENLQWNEISKIIGLSSTQCINLQNNGKEIIRKKLKKENLYESKGI